MMRRRMLSIILCGLMILTGLCLPVGAETFSDGNVTYTYEITEEATVKLLSVTGVNPKQGVTVPRELNEYTVTAIGYGFLDEALSSGDDLTSLLIPNTVIQIDPGFLTGAKMFNMNAGKDQPLLQLEEGNPVYTYHFQDQIGSLIETETGRLIAIPEHRNKTIAIPSEAKILGASALEGMNIHTLYIPATLEKIEEGALDAAEEIEWLELEEGCTAFAIQGRKLLDAEGNVVYPAEKEQDPTESYTTSDGITVTPMTQEQKQELQEKERKDRWINVLGYGLVALLVIAVVLVIWQTIRGEGPMHLAALFEQPPLFFFDMVLCIGILLLPQMLEEEVFWLAGDKLAISLTIIAIVMGIAGVIAEFIHVGLFWALPRLLVKAVLLVALAALSLTESIFAMVVVFVVLWRVVTNAVRGAWSIFCGLGLAPVFEVIGDVADLMTETASTILTPQEELRELRYSDVTGTDRYFVGPAGIVHIKEEPYSNTARVKYDGRSLTAAKMPDGSWLIDEPLHKAEKTKRPTAPQKERKQLTRNEHIQFILIGAGRLAPSILILLQFIESMF